jgi:hypothetical protein
MKTNKIVSLITSLIILMFVSSKSLTAQTERSISESAINSNDCIKWLNAQFQLNTPLRNNFIKNLLHNLDTINISREVINRNEFLIIIPLKEIHYSQNVKKAESPISIFLLVEDTNHRIRRGDVVHFYPKSTGIKKLPKNLLHDFFGSQDLSVDGTVMLSNLSDVKQFEMTIVNGRNMEFKVWLSKLIDDCKYWEWHLQTTNSKVFYETGDPKHLKITSEFLGTSEKECPPGYSCD